MTNDKLPHRLFPILALALLIGCHQGAGGIGELPATDPSSLPPVPPEQALKYLNGILKDKTRLVQVFVDQGMSGELDSAGKKSLRKSLAGWWQAVEVVPPPEQQRGLHTIRITPDMGINIFPPGSADATSEPGVGRLEPHARILIYRSRSFSRVEITDPTAGRLDGAVYIIRSNAPMDWLKRLFAGQM